MHSFLASWEVSWMQSESSSSSHWLLLAKSRYVLRYLKTSHGLPESHKTSRHELKLSGFSLHPGGCREKFGQAVYWLLLSPFTSEHFQDVTRNHFQLKAVQHLQMFKLRDVEPLDKEGPLYTVIYSWFTDAWPRPHQHFCTGIVLLVLYFCGSSMLFWLISIPTFWRISGKEPGNKLEI